MQLGFLSASVALVLCACQTHGDLFSVELANAVYHFLNLDSIAKNASKSLMRDIGIHVACSVRELCSSETEASARKHLLADNRAYHQVYSHIAFAAFCAIETCVNELNRSEMEIGKPSDSLQMDVKVALHLFKTYFTPKTLFIQSNTKLYFWLDIPPSFARGLSVDVFDHIFNVLDTYPTKLQTTTGMFASNLLRWSFQQQFDQRYPHSVHYQILRRMKRHALLTQQTLLNTIQYVHYTFAFEFKFASNTVVWLLDNFTEDIAAVRLIVPSFEWLINIKKAEERLFPTPNANEYNERKKVQSGLMALIKDVPLTNRAGEEVFFLSRLFLNKTHSDGEVRNPHIGSAILALLDVGHDGAVTVATSIIRYLSKFGYKFYASEVLRQVVEHGQDVDPDIKLDGFTVGEHVQKIVAKGIMLPPCSPANMELYLMFHGAQAMREAMQGLQDTMASIQEKQKSYLVCSVTEADAQKDSQLLLVIEPAAASGPRHKRQKI